MRHLEVATACVILVGLSTAANAQAPQIDLEVAVQPDAPFGAQERWFKVLKELELGALRLREARPNERPQIESAGTEKRPRYRLTMIVGSDSRLRAPGAEFGPRDLERIARYLRTLREEGIDGVTASRGLFDLTDTQFEQIIKDLSPPVGISSAGRRPREIVDALADRLAHRLVIDGELVERLNHAEAASEELQEISRGTGLAIVLRQSGLHFRPELLSGSLRYRVVVAERPSDRTRRAPVEQTGPAQFWPVGWEPEDSPGETAPELFEIINAQIDGYSLAEAMEAIVPRVKLPVFYDRHALQQQAIDMKTIQVRLAAGRHSYDRILSRILYQAELKGALRVDERGTPFYWITTLEPQ